jgi:hypothetical protein
MISIKYNWIMGGLFSGRRKAIPPKATVEDCYVIDSFQCAARHRFRDAIAAIQISYQINGETLAYPLLLNSTCPHFGGRKWWFSCLSCNRRVRKLFRPPNRQFYACRTCWNLGYQTRHEGPRGRAGLKVLRMCRHLRASFDSFDDPPRPKGMWRRRYERLVHELNQAERRYFAMASGVNDRLAAHLGKHHPDLWPTGVN